MNNNIQSYIPDNIDFIIGADEVGTGAWCGKICVAAVCAPRSWKLSGLNDSKKLTRKSRAKLNERLWDLHHQKHIIIVIKSASNSEIDSSGLGVTLKKIYVEAIDECHNLACQQDTSTNRFMGFMAILDGKIKLDGINIPYKSIVRADSKFPSVMAASVVAKVHRDNWMIEQDKVYPEYGWKHNVGYITNAHLESVRKYGMSPLHRKSYKVKV